MKVQKQAIIEAYLRQNNGPNPGTNQTSTVDGLDGPSTSSSSANDLDNNNMGDNLSAALFLEIQQKFQARRNWKWMKHLTFRNTCYMHPQGNFSAYFSYTLIYSYRLPHTPELRHYRSLTYNIPLCP